MNQKAWTEKRKSELPLCCDIRTTAGGFDTVSCDNAMCNVRGSCICAQMLAAAPAARADIAPETQHAWAAWAA